MTDVLEQNEEILKQFFAEKEGLTFFLFVCSALFAFFWCFGRW